MKEGATRDPKYDYGEEEELHVLVTGEREDEARARTHARPLPPFGALFLSCFVFFWGRV